MIPRTIENTRELDETVCKPDDEEVFPVPYMYIETYMYAIVFMKHKDGNIHNSCNWFFCALVAHRKDVSYL